MDHDFTELKLLMLLIPNILCDHGNAFTFAGKAGPAVQSVAVVIFPIKCADSRSFTNAPVTRRTSFVMLPSKIKWL
jgi:hypothetical protein